MIYTLNEGDYVTYTDLFGRKREIRYIKNTGLVRAIVGQDYCLQQQFKDEVDAIVHIPINAWAVSGIRPFIIRKSDYGL